MAVNIIEAVQSYERVQQQQKNEEYFYPIHVFVKSSEEHDVKSAVALLNEQISSEMEKC